MAYAECGICQDLPFRVIICTVCGTVLCPTCWKGHKCPEKIKLEFREKVIFT